MNSGNEINIEIEKREILEHLERSSLFYIGMIHDLKSPIATIQGYCGLVKDEVLEAKEIPNIFSNIEKVSTHMNVLVNNLLDLSSSEEKDICIVNEKVDAQAFFHNISALVVATFMNQGNKFGIKVEKGIMSFSADIIKLKQILINLISNANKFTSNGVITLSLQHVKNKLQFVVADTGIGITDEQAARIFQPFEQATESTGRSYGGSGVGLAISFRFAEAMGGTIEVDNQREEGTAFIVTIPIIDQ
ncbi:MAG: HAMP domain-containing histidine kinase [Methylococcales bacterium]|nr:HAMP domain-containing histidine kinase [Methylococcales bacterium]